MATTRRRQPAATPPTRLTGRLELSTDLGAFLGDTRVRLLEADEENESCLVMQDVEGNEFCLD